MARYDATWRGGRDRGYDAPYGNFEPRRPGGGFRGYDAEMVAGPDWDRDVGAATYGPARYGLGPYHDRLRKRRRSDDDLRADVEEALFYDTWVDAEAITVKVEEGVVVLSGELPSYDEVRYATDDAWDVDGVVGVRSELGIRRD